MLRGAILGVVAFILIGLLSGYAIVAGGYVPSNADTPPGPIETWLAHKGLHAAIWRLAPRDSNPLKADDKNLIAGIRLYSVHCAVCHGAADGKPSAIAKGLYQEPPQLAKHGVEDDPDWDTRWKIDHGIRMTGMPGFGKSISSTDIWRLALFLKHMDSLPPGALKAWKAVPNQS